MPPPPALDPVLDATVECVSRHGLAKTSLSDIGREMGVAPSTVYRKVGSVENAVLLVLAREAKLLLDRMPEIVSGVEGARVITVFMTAAIETVAGHPAFAKVLRDETEWIGRLLTRRVDGLVDQAVEIIAPLLDAAMVAGQIRRQDPVALAHWLVRVGGMALLAPPPGELQAALDALLLPTMETTRRRAKR